MQLQGVLKVAWSTATDQLPRINALVKNEIVSLGSLRIFFFVSVCIFDNHHRQRGWIWRAKVCAVVFVRARMLRCVLHKEYVRHGDRGFESGYGPVQDFKSHSHVLDDRWGTIRV